MFITIKKESLLIIAVIALISIIGIIIFSQIAVSEVVLKSNKKLPVYCVDTKEKVVALTFDAAWGADKTEGILNILDEFGAKGTFFLVGFWIDKFEDKVRLIDDRGMLIGNHSNNHLKMSLLKEDNIVKELAYVNRRLKEITGKDTKFFRAPFGDYNNLLVETVRNQGMMTIQWDVDSLDWKGLSANEITLRVTGKVKSGSIVLFHNNSDNILEALPAVMTKLKNEGYRFVTLDEMVYKENYYIDNNGVQRIKL
ncbi:MAG: polysaccharide deacetylase family protein [Christensenellales bacterium]